MRLARLVGAAALFAYTAAAHMLHMLARLLDLALCRTARALTGIIAQRYLYGWEDRMARFAQALALYNAAILVRCDDARIVRFALGAQDAQAVDQVTHEGQKSVV